VSHILTPVGLSIDPIAEARRHWEERWGPEPARSMAAITSIVRAQQLLLARYDELLRPFGITFARYELLMLLLFTREGALPVGKIGERLQVHRTSVTNAVDKLLADGLVERTPHPSDGRATLVGITEPGRDVAMRATDVLNGAEFAVTALATEDREALTRILTALRRDAGDFA
jgi:DNA-binding MarR family transcriptional regulator